jgi:hypothetical protein
LYSSFGGLFHPLVETLRAAIEGEKRGEMMEQQALRHEPHISPVDGSFCRLAKPVERERGQIKKKKKEKKRESFLFTLGWSDVLALKMNEREGDGRTDGRWLRVFPTTYEFFCQRVPSGVGALQHLYTHVLVFNNLCFKGETSIIIVTKFSI